MTTPARTLAVVAIGRNEGERFERCAASLHAERERLADAGVRCTLVYVDSGSTDQSLHVARTAGFHTVALDMSIPFTAARARNAGLREALAHDPAAHFVQFIDGDCEIVQGWLACAAKTLAADPAIAAVSGRLRERFPNATLYNRLGDLEWDRPVGDEKSCGGVAMLRISAMQRAGGFDDSLIAGEEPELCARMRAHGGRIIRLAHDMAWHDLAMTTRAQWLKRARRHGHAILEVSHFKTPASRGLFSSQLRSALFWGLAWPLALIVSIAAMLAALLTRPHWALLAACAAGLLALLAIRRRQSLKIAAQGVAKGLDAATARAYAALIMASKWANVQGMADFLLRRLRRQHATVISYKEPA